MCKLIFDRIDFAKNHDKFSDAQAVQALIKGLYAPDGKAAWQWLKKWYEKQLLAAWENYRSTSNDIAIAIDDINKRLSEWPSVMDEIDKFNRAGKKS